MKTYLKIDMSKIQKVEYGTERCCASCAHRGEFSSTQNKVDYCKLRPREANKCGHQSVKRFYNVCDMYIGRAKR